MYNHSLIEKLKPSLSINKPKTTCYSLIRETTLQTELTHNRTN